MRSAADFPDWERMTFGSSDSGMLLMHKLWREQIARVQDGIDPVGIARGVEAEGDGPRFPDGSLSWTGRRACACSTRPSTNALRLRWRPSTRDEARAAHRPDQGAPPALVLFAAATLAACTTDAPPIASPTPTGDPPTGQTVEGTTPTPLHASRADAGPDAPRQPHPHLATPPPTPPPPPRHRAQRPRGRRRPRLRRRSPGNAHLHPPLEDRLPLPHRPLRRDLLRGRRARRHPAHRLAPGSCPPGTPPGG